MTRRLASLGDAREAVGVVPGVERVGLVGGGELDAPICGVIGVPHGALRSGLGRRTGLQPARLIAVTAYGQGRYIFGQETIRPWHLKF